MILLASINMQPFNNDGERQTKSAAFIEADCFLLQIVVQIESMEAIQLLLLIAVLPLVVQTAVRNDVPIGKSTERLFPAGPKVSIKSSSISGSRQRSDLHEVYLAPYRYVSLLQLLDNS